MTRLDLSLLPLLSPLALAAPGCDTISHSCTTIGCADTLGVRVAAAHGALPPGTYDVTVELDGARAKVECFVESPPVNSSCSAIENAAVFLSTQAIVGVSGDLQLDLAVLATPSSVVVTVERDGSAVASQTLAPTYQTSRPNGPDCGPICRQGGIIVEL